MCEDQLVKDDIQLLFLLDFCMLCDSLRVARSREDRRSKKRKVMTEKEMDGQTDTQTDKGKYYQSKKTTGSQWDTLCWQN